MFDLTGKKALVTGSSRGIGRGIALAMAKQGADVCINFRSNKDEAEIVVAEIKALGRDSFAAQADVSQAGQVVKMFEDIKTKWGRLDILVNNAGIGPMVPFEQMTEEQWDAVLDTNLKGQFLCAKEAIKLLNKGGRIINMASIASGGVGVGFGRVAHYVASKGGSVALTEDLAVELAPKGININAIAPGIIETDMTQEIIASSGSGLLTKIPKGRFGKPEDIGAAAVFLASDEADYITGAVLYVDGGWLAA